MLNTSGEIAEGSGENLFLVRDGVLYTPPISTGCLDGITRDSVTALMRDDGYTIKERIMHRSDLYYCDELFLTGTAAEVTPIREVDDRPVGTGTPGSVTRRAQELFAGTVAGDLNTHPEWLEYV